jgi:hypothetical protein
MAFSLDEVKIYPLGRPYSALAASPRPRHNLPHHSIIEGTKSMGTAVAIRQTKNLERCTLCRMSDDRVCSDCLIPADKPAKV